MPRRYLAAHSSLAYATTAHAALGRTTDTAHVLVDGLADRPGLYVAMSRGREANYGYCVTQSPRLADVAAGSGRAPELDRAVGLDRERAGLPPAASRPPRTRGGDTGPVPTETPATNASRCQHSTTTTAAACPEPAPDTQNAVTRTPAAHDTGTSPQPATSKPECQPQT